MKRLIGLQIGPGWRRRVHDLVGRTAGCTHLVELLGPLATTAYQTMHWALEERAESKPERDKPAIIDTCHALASDSPIVKLEWPVLHRQRVAGRRHVFRQLSVGLRTGGGPAYHDSRRGYADGDP